MNQEQKGKDKKQEINIKKSQVEDVLKRAPDEVLAMAIRDTLLKEKEKQNK